MLFLCLKTFQRDFPGGVVDRNYFAKGGEMDLIPWSGKIPHAMELLSPCATTTEPELHGLCSYWNPQGLELVLHNKTRHSDESLWTTIKSSPSSLQLEEAQTKQWRHSTAQNKAFRGFPKSSKHAMGPFMLLPLPDSSLIFYRPLPWSQLSHHSPSFIHRLLPPTPKMLPLSQCIHPHLHQSK